MKAAIFAALLVAPLAIAGTGAASHSTTACTIGHAITTVSTGQQWPDLGDPTLPSGEIILYYIHYDDGVGTAGLIDDWNYAESGKVPGLQEGRGEYITEEQLHAGLDPANTKCRWPVPGERDLLIL